MLQVNKYLVERYFNKLCKLVPNEDGELVPELTPDFETLKSELELKIYKLRYPDKNFQPKNNGFDIHYFIVYSYRYLDDIEIMLAYTKCYYYMNRLKKNPVNSIHDLLKEIVNPKFWNALVYIYDNIVALKSEKITIATIYSRFGAKFTKQVIERNILLRYNYSYFVGFLVKVKDYEMFYYVMGKLLTNTYWINELNNSKNFQGVTSFMYACRNGDMEIIKYIANNTKVNINKFVNSQYNHEAFIVFENICEEDDYCYKNAALIMACAGGQLEVVKLLLSKNIDINTLYDNKYNMATVSLVSCNKILIDFLVSEFNLTVQFDFIENICKHGTLDMLEFTYNNFGINRSNRYVLKLFELAYNSNNIPIMEYLINKINNNIFRNLLLHEFVQYCLIPSEYIQTRIFESNPGFLEDDEDEVQSLPFNNDVKKFIGVKNNKLSDNYEYLLFNFLSFQKSKPVILYNIHNYGKSISNNISEVVLAFKDGENYKVVSNNYCYWNAKFGYYKINKEKAINSWASNFTKISHL